MSKNKVAAVKLFDNRNPVIHNQCGRQERWCSCFLELTNQTSKLNINAFKDQENQQKKNSENNNICVKKNSTVQISDNDNNSSKENYFTPLDEEIFLTNIHLNEYSTNEIENGMKKDDIEVSETDSLDETSNSVTNNCNIDFEITSVDETSNSSWKDVSQEHLINNENHEVENIVKTTVDIKATRNTFPTVFNKKELSCHMNMCSDKNDIVIPIRYFKKFNEITSRIENCTTVGIHETSTDYDLDTDKLNMSLVEYPIKSSNSLHSKTSYIKTTVSDKIKSNFKSEITKKQLKSSNIFLYAYISDIKGIQESLILNKDRRFARILDRYNCRASIVQLRNLSRGFPHTLLKIECESKLNLSLMARDTDRIHLSWNLRSQLRSIHVH